MELRDFRNWIIENDFEDNELFQESLICYCNRAYKAAYMFSYLAFIEYIRDSIIEYKGIPIRFEEEWTEKLKNDNCKSETEKKTYIENEWRKKINDLNNEDKWEDTFKSIIGKADYNIFCYDTKIRLEFEVKKNHRNVCAHNKERIISNATVEDLWDFIAYVKPLSVINGTSQYLIKMINDVIRFCNKSEYKEKAKDIIRFYNKICGEEKKKVFIELCKMVNLYYSVDSNIFMIELFELIFYKADVEEYQWISQDCKIELFVKINISNYMKELDKVQFYRYAESTDKDWSRFEISAPTTIMKNGNNDLLKKKFLLEVYNDENHYNNWSNMLLVSDKWQNYIYESEIISIIKKSENVDSVLNEIEKLYQYNSFYGWKQTNTFDYCNFVADDKIARKVKMILLLVMKGEIDITNKKISELINRCKMVINITDNKNNCYYISEYLRRNEELFSWLQSIEITH